MEDLHKRSINMSRAIAGAEAWRESDCDGAGLLPMQDPEDWDPVAQAYPSQPDWDTRSINDSRMSMAPGTPVTPGTPGQWSHDTLTPANDSYLAAPRFNQEGRRGSFDTTDGNDYFSPRSGNDSPQEGYNHFLDKANRAIARDQKHAPDPFLDPNAALAAPHRPFGAHSRVSSVESIASIIDEKANSPLNKAIASVRVAFMRVGGCTNTE
jgi:alpha-1,3-glucan synthase